MYLYKYVSILYTCVDVEMSMYVSIIFQNVVIRFNALDEMIDFRTEKANIFVLLFVGVGN